jgi:2-polyprenyl-6-methoxyphenol hydroxylase-like FAD-dependent oxidoreductase
MTTHPNDATHETETPVLIAGAGPAGLTAAIALARAGVRSTLVERRPQLSPLPKATTESIRTMELLRHWGLEAKARAEDPGVEWLCWTAESLAAADAGMEVQLGIPTRAQAALVSPTVPGCIPQDHLEPVLMEHLRELGMTEVAFGTEVTDVAQLERGAAVTLRDPDGSSRAVHARYVVAADGGRSTVRDLVGVRMEGSGKLEDAVSALFRAPFWDLVGEHRYGMYSPSSPEAPGIFLPAGRGDRWIYGLIVPPDGPPAESIGAEDMSRQVEIGSGLPGFRPRIERLGRFAFEAGLAETFRAGDVFLAGDAAHRVTPRGGTGMNMAIHGAFDLGWKLAWVLRGWAPSALLDTYEEERLPVVTHNVERSRDPGGSMRAVEDELTVDLGGRIPHAWTESDEGRVSTLDLLGDGLTLLTANRAGWSGAEDGSGPPVAVREVGPIAARALGVATGGALLVRPDGRPIGWVDDRADATGAMRAALAAAMAGRTVAPREPLLAV